MKVWIVYGSMTNGTPVIIEACSSFEKSKEVYDKAKNSGLYNYVNGEERTIK